MPQGRQNAQAENFARLIKPHFDQLFRLAWRLTGTRQDAEDLVQEVLTELYEKYEILETVEDLRSWLCRVLYNRFVDSTRAQRRRPLALVGDDAGLEDAMRSSGKTAADPADLDIAERRVERLQHGLSRLSEDHRRLLLLHDAEGYTLPELETLTGTPIGTLKSRLSRARARLRELLWDLPEAAEHRRAAANPTTDEKKLEPFSRGGRVGG